MEKYFLDSLARLEALNKKYNSAMNSDTFNLQIRPCIDYPREGRENYRKEI